MISLLFSLLSFVTAQKCKDSCMNTCLDLTPGMDCYPKCCNFNPEMYAVVPLYKLNPDGTLSQVQDALKYPDCDEACADICLEKGENQWKCAYQCKCSPLNLVPTIYESRLAHYSIPLITNIETMEKGTNLLEATLKAHSKAACERSCTTQCKGQSSDCEIECLGNKCLANSKYKLSTMMIFICGFITMIGLGFMKKRYASREVKDNYTLLTEQ